jgi:hypothetical protein
MNTIETNQPNPITNEPQVPVVRGQPATIDNYGPDFNELA